MIEQRVNIDSLSINKQKIIKDYETYLEFFEKYLKYRLNIKASELVDENDPALGWGEPYIIDYEIYFYRTLISKLSKEYKAREDKWLVTIESSGVNFIILIYYKKEEDAQKLLDKLLIYTT
jgi:hypothetical protein